MKMQNIAIDGPAGAGKSTVAKLVAKRLNYLYIDTGAMFRALTFKALELGMDLKNGAILGEYLGKHRITLINKDGIEKVYFDDEDITEKIRSLEVTKHVSLVATHKEVREIMLNMQRIMAMDNNVVMDGRDIGTHVLPEAKHKFFLTATIEERAQRRYTELITKGIEANLSQIKEDIAKRDKQDQEREIAPLIKAVDAILIDSSTLTIEEVVNQIIKHVKSD